MRSEPHLVFPPFRLDRVNAQLWRGDQEISLRPKTFEVLHYLVDHPGELVTKAALLDSIWAGVTVSDSMPATCVAELRKALGDDAETPQFIQTVHRRGYRFIAQVTTAAAREATRKPPDAPKGPKPIMVGREEELAQLQGWYSDVLAGQRRVVFVSGEAGIGKTTLVEAFLDSIAQAGKARLGHGQCVEQYGAGEPYLPVLEALSRLGRESSGGQVIELLGKFAPTWLAQMPELLTPEERARLQSGTQGITQQRMLREMAQALEALATEAPLVLLLEDLHWSDFSTLELISAIARRSEPARLLIVATYRPAEILAEKHPLRTMKQELELHRHCEELRLKLLSEKNVVSYLKRRFPTEDSRQFGIIAPLLHERSDGNPLFMVNVVDYLSGGVGAGVRSREISAAKWTKTLRADDLHVPSSIRQMIELNLERLKPDEQAVLEGASAVGPEFSAASVAAALERPEEEIEACCAGLSRREQFISTQGPVAWPDGTIATGFGFHHALYQVVLYGRLPAGYQLRLHRRIALREEAGYGQHAGEIASKLAYHYRCANEKIKAIQYLRVAAERAIARWAFTEATSLLESAIEIVSTLPSDSTTRRMELDLQTMLGVAFNSAKGFSSREAAATFERARDLFQQVASLGEDIADSLLEFAMMYGVWANYYNACRPELLEYARQFLTLAETRAARVPLLIGNRIVGTSLAYLGEFFRAKEYLDKAVSLYEPERDSQLTMRFGQDIGVSALANRAWANTYLGCRGKALADIEAALAMAESLGHVPTTVYVLTFAAIMEAVWRNFDRAEAQSRELISLSDKHALPLWLGFGTMALGLILAIRGDSVEAIEKIHKALAIKHSIGCRLFDTFCSGGLANAYMRIGRYEEALDALEQGLATVIAINERWVEAELHRQRAEVFLSMPRSDYAAAEECFLEALSIARRQNAKLYELRTSTGLARMWIKQGKRVQAHDLLIPICRWFAEELGTADLNEAKRLLSSERRAG